MLKIISSSMFPKFLETTKCNRCGISVHKNSIESHNFLLHGTKRKHQEVMKELVLISPKSDIQDVKIVSKCESEEIVSPIAKIQKLEEDSLSEEFKVSTKCTTIYFLCIFNVETGLSSCTILETLPDVSKHINNFKQTASFKQHRLLVDGEATTTAETVDVVDFEQWGIYVLMTHKRTVKKVQDVYFLSITYSYGKF
jgi:hypothetical protein